MKFDISKTIGVLKGIKNSRVERLKQVYGGAEWKKYTDIGGCPHCGESVFLYTDSCSGKWTCYECDFESPRFDDPIEAYDHYLRTCEAFALLEDIEQEIKG